MIISIKHTSILCLAMMWLKSVDAQLTFYRDIEPIIMENCVNCHYPEGSAPFSLIGYQNVAKRANFVRHVTKTRYMPPWKANPDYRSFANEKLLSDEEIDKIDKWVNTGSPKGKKKDSQYKNYKVSDANAYVKEPDLLLRMEEAFTIPGNNEQTYICYKIPYELPNDTFVNGVQFIPGNKKLVHHASYQVMEIAEDVDPEVGPTYFIYGDSDYVNDLHDYGKMNLIDSKGNFPRETYHGGWLPGSSAQIYPEGIGFRLPKKGVFLIRNLHYAPSPVEEIDQSSVALYFAEKPVERKILFKAFAPINKHPEKDWIIPADSIKTFEINVNIGAELSLLSINPHMHLLGKYFKAYILTPSNDSIPLVEIRDWDFNWQEFYQFKHPIRVPKGSFLKAIATYHNTRDNESNPNQPPIDVYFERGMDDKDEMMRLVFLFMPYKEGDEKIYVK